MSAVYRGSFGDSSPFSQQQEAINRVRNLQESAAQRLSQTQQMPIAHLEQGVKSKEKETHMELIKPSENNQTQAPKPQNIISSIISSLGASGDSDNSQEVSQLGELLKTTITSISAPAGKLLDDFNIDGEKLVIMIVMWVIFSEKGDNTLLLALGYLLL